MMPGDEMIAPRIAICVIARNEASTIGALVAQLATQTLLIDHENVDLFVVSNGSNDGTAEKARAAIDAELGATRVRSIVHDTTEGGKARSWNLAVHDLIDPASDIVIFLDADIELAHERVLSGLVERLVSRQDLRAVSGFPVKDIARKDRKTFIDRFSLKISSDSPAPHAINGSLYAVWMRELLKIWLPVPTPGEDGVLSAMLHTNGFTEPACLQRIERMPAPTHYFEAHDVAGFFKHERRMTLGTTINGWIFEHLWAGRHEHHVGTLIRDWNAHDPQWIDRLVAARVGNRIWALPPRMLSWRLHNLKGVGLRRALVRAPFSLGATILNLWPSIEANRMLKRKGAARYW